MAVLHLKFQCAQFFYALLSNVKFIVLCCKIRKKKPHYPLVRKYYLKKNFVAK